MGRPVNRSEKGLACPEDLLRHRCSVRSPPSADIIIPDLPMRHLRLGKDHDSLEVTQLLREGQGWDPNLIRICPRWLFMCVPQGGEAAEKHGCVSETHTVDLLRTCHSSKASLGDGKSPLAEFPGPGRVQGTSLTNRAQRPEADPSVGSRLADWILREGRQERSPPQRVWLWGPRAARV